MGNSMGGFREYWELIRREPKYQGGFIWDFVDQSLHKKGRNGVTVYGYGGDWNPYDPSDQNFCDNGLIGPDRIPNPHMEEVRYYYQSVWTSWAGDAGNTVEVLNENFFRGLENYDLHWEVLCDGTPLRRGVVDGLKAAPQQRVRIALPYDPATLPAAGELLLEWPTNSRRPKASCPRATPRRAPSCRSANTSSRLPRRNPQPKVNRFSLRTTTKTS